MNNWTWLRNWSWLRYFLLLFNDWFLKHNNKEVSFFYVVTYQSFVILHNLSKNNQFLISGGKRLATFFLNFFNFLLCRANCVVLINFKVKLLSLKSFDYNLHQNFKYYSFG